MAVPLHASAQLQRNLAVADIGQSVACTQKRRMQHASCQHRREDNPHASLPSAFAADS
jgi:hypothetical protein